MLCGGFPWALQIAQRWRVSARRGTRGNIWWLGGFAARDTPQPPLHSCPPPDQPPTGPFPGIPCSRILFSPTPPAFLPYPPRDPATIFHSELIDLFGLHKGGREPVDQLLVTLRQLQAARIRTVMFSISWAWLEPAQGQLRWGYLEDVVGSACSHTELKVSRRSGRRGRRGLGALAQQSFQVAMYDCHQHSGVRYL